MLVLRLVISLLTVLKPAGGAPPGGGTLLLRDGVSHLLLRDGVSKLLLGHM